MAMPAIKGPSRPPVVLSLIRPAELRRRYSLRVLRHRLRQNLGLRIISVLLALGLWVFVNAGQHSSLQSFNVPIGYRALPFDFVITNPHPDFVKVQLSGPPTLLSLVDPNRLTLRLDLSGVGVGQASFKIGPDSFNVPRGTAVSSISPSQIVLDLDKVIAREVPLHVAKTGRIADGYRIASIQATPSSVRVRAPSRQLARIDTINTESVDISGLSGPFTRALAVVAPGGMARVTPTEVIVRITLTPVMASKDFHGVPIVVRNTDHQTKVEPERVNLTLRGPKLVLGKLDLKGAVYVDADGLTPGSHDATVQMQLPEGVELQRQWPEKVRIRIKHALNG
ncbi:MAG TPA: CdaR family protein [Candidatus Binataceae bacterium]|nr:CdaR family protein [Candidatus Binataceae bacterium]